MMLLTSSVFGQTCYTVKGVENKTENPDLSSKRFTFGVKEITEELISEKYDLCERQQQLDIPHYEQRFDQFSTLVQAHILVLYEYYLRLSGVVLRVQKLL